MPEVEDQRAEGRRAALGEFNGGWVDGMAIQSLKLIASDQRRRILEEARPRNPNSDEPSSTASSWQAPGGGITGVMVAPLATRKK